MTRYATFLLLFGCGIAAAQSATKPVKLSASAIQVAMLDSGDIAMPAEFRYAVYERLIDQIRATGKFQKVYRMGDSAAASVPDLVTLHTKVEAFKEGSQTARELVTVAGWTKIDIDATVTGHDGQSLLDKKITGRVRFFGENLGVTKDLAKRITKLLQDSF